MSISFSEILDCKVKYEATANLNFQRGGGGSGGLGENPFHKGHGYIQEHLLHILGVRNHKNTPNYSATRLTVATQQTFFYKLAIKCKTTCFQ